MGTTSPRHVLILVRWSTINVILNFCLFSWFNKFYGSGVKAWWNKGKGDFGGGTGVLEHAVAGFMAGFFVGGGDSVSLVHVIRHFGALLYVLWML